MRESGALVKAPFDMRRFYNPDLLAGRVAIVTGGATGVGLVAARALAQVGATVVLASRKEDFLRRSVEDLRSENLRAGWKILDVRDADTVERVFGEVALERGRLDVLVNKCRRSVRAAGGADHAQWLASRHRRQPQCRFLLCIRRRQANDRGGNRRLHSERHRILRRPFLGGHGP